MKESTRILSHLLDATKSLEDAQQSLTLAHVALQKRRGLDARAAYEAVSIAREAFYEPDLGDLLEDAITISGRMP